MKKRLLRRVLWSIAVALLVSYIFYHSQYSLNENKVIRNSYPSEKGEVMYDQSYDSEKVVIWKTGHRHYVKLVKRKMGIFHHVPKVSELLPMTPLIGENGAIKRTWSASLNSNNMYETIIAVQTDRSDIRRIIVSNDSIDHEILDELNEIEENSTVFMELNLENGFAAVYVELNSNDAGGFIFRGINEDDEIILLGR